MARRVLYMVICAACWAACADQPSTTTSAQKTQSPQIDSLYIFVRNSPAEEYAELALERYDGQTTVTLSRPGDRQQPRVVLDSFGPAAKDPDIVVAMLDSFDIWAMNAPDAPGAACMTVEGERVCNRTLDDYSLVMKVESNGHIGVQRYTGLEKSTSSTSARALGDYILEWARKRERGEQVMSPD